MYKSHPLSAKEHIAVQDLNRGSIIALTRGMIMQQRLDDLFHQAELVPHIRIETPTVLSACQLALQGIGHHLEGTIYCKCL